MKNKIIVFSSVKGGVGKTSLCANFATFFAEQGVPVIVIDVDRQRSLSRHRERDLKAQPGADIPWNIEWLNTKDIENVRTMIERAKQLPCCVLIDCPGNIQDEALEVIFEAANIAVVPYELNSDSVDATILFAQTFSTGYDAKMFFIPNKVSAVFEKRSETRKAREDAIEGLKKLGTITPDMKYTVHLSEYSTIEVYNWKKRAAIRDAFAPIYKYVKR